MTDELRRGFNAKAGGKQVCPECKVQEIYEKLGHLA